MSTSPARLESVARLFGDVYSTLPNSLADAPGRVEVIGNHTDYNGGSVVGAALERGTAVAMGLRADGRIRLISDTRQAAVPVETTMTSFTSERLPDWCAYPLGVIDEARLNGWVPEGAGLDLAIHSTLPIGAGLASSAALELAVAGALVPLFFEAGNEPGIEMLVAAAHRAENRFVGMPCGLLDQTVVGHAREDHLIVMDAATNRHDVVPIPSSLGFVLFQSHVSHALVTSPYEERHRECRQALMGLQRFIPGLRHLASVHPADLDAYGSVLETRPRMRAQHVVEEQVRVLAFQEALRNGKRETAGALMSASHESSRLLFDNSTPELDVLVASASQQENVLGARLSGGGWGGTVVALVRDTFSDHQAESICDTYEELFEVRPHWWRSRACRGLVQERLEP